jgi:hypothetical protein
MKRFAQIILLAVSFTFAACADKIVDGQTVSANSAKGNSGEKNTQASPKAILAEKQPSTEDSRKCQPENVGGEQPPAKLEDRGEIDDWLKNIVGAVHVATLADRQSIERYYAEGDFNADGCGDIVLIVQDVYAKSKAVSAESLNLKETTIIQNLGSKARRVKSKQETGLLVVFGNRRDWDWKSDAGSRAFLLSDSISKPVENSAFEASATLFNVIRKNKPEEDDDDLLYRFPANAAGDCIYTAIQIKRRKSDFSELSSKFLICYDGEMFFNKKLPDSKSYPFE